MSELRVAIFSRIVKNSRHLHHGEQTMAPFLTFILSFKIELHSLRNLIRKNLVSVIYVVKQKPQYLRQKQKFGFDSIIFFMEQKIWRIRCLTMKTFLFQLSSQLFFRYYYYVKFMLRGKFDNSIRKYEILMGAFRDFAPSLLHDYWTFLQTFSHPLNSYLLRGN